MKDMGDAWFDDKMEWTYTYDKDGNVTGGYYCPYIPKDFAKTDKERLEMDKICTPPSTLIKKFLDSKQD